MLGSPIKKLQKKKADSSNKEFLAKDPDQELIYKRTGCKANTIFNKQFFSPPFQQHDLLSSAMQSIQNRFRLLEICKLEKKKSLKQKLLRSLSEEFPKTEKKNKEKKKKDKKRKTRPSQKSKSKSLKDLKIFETPSPRPAKVKVLKASSID